MPEPHTIALPSARKHSLADLGSKPRRRTLALNAGATTARGTSRPPLATLAIGQTSQPEFTPLVERLAALSTLRCSSDLDEARAAAQETWFDLLLLFQSRPGEFDAGRLDVLRRRLPLARVLVVASSWCEGETRSGRPIPGAIRLYWHQAESYFRDQFRLVAQGRCPAWGLPLPGPCWPTSGSSPGPSTSERKIVISTTSMEAGRLLADLCALAGYACESIGWGEAPPDQAAAAMVIDIAGDVDGALEYVKLLRTQRPGLPLVAVTNFPRWDHVEILKRASVRAVIAKPLEPGDLLDRIAQLEMKG